MNPNIVIPQGVDPKQFDAMMQNGGVQPIPVQVPRELKEAQKKYIEEGVDIYAELTAIKKDNPIAKALIWIMESQLPYDIVKDLHKAAEEAEKLSEEN